MQVTKQNKIKYKQNTLTYIQVEKYNFFFSLSLSCATNNLLGYHKQQELVNPAQQFSHEALLQSYCTNNTWG